MICPKHYKCNKRTCRHIIHHKFDPKCNSTCGHIEEKRTGVCVDETEIKKTGKLTKLRVGEKEIRMWSQGNDS